MLSPAWRCCTSCFSAYAHRHAIGSDSSVEKQWGDTAYTKLEEKLGRVIGSLEYIGEKERDERLKLEALWREQRREEDIRKELNAKKQSEFNNFKSYLYCW
ncbi:hypothetical protein EF405_19005 [Cyclobacteriaceae bacterium YHN15]|nr:hypothetical protein EF405_19005 [Cyclobacteriaceae bacterium YHN15]